MRSLMKVLGLFGLLLTGNLTRMTAEAFAPPSSALFRDSWNGATKHSRLPSPIVVRISDDTLAYEAFEWCSNLGAPSALVAGAVLATLSQTREDLAPKNTDTAWMRFAKRLCRALLLSSFGMEIVCIFVTTVTGTMLLSHGDIPAGIHAGKHYHSPMGFLNHNHEFEYLTSRVMFLQGLFHWLAAVALEIVIPKAGEGAASRKMNQFISAGLVAIILMMLSFYNGHMSFYANYFDMLTRYICVAFLRYFWKWPPRPMSFFSGPAFLLSSFLGWRAFTSPPDEAPELVPEKVDQNVLNATVAL